MTNEIDSTELENKAIELYFYGRGKGLKILEEVENKLEHWNNLKGIIRSRWRKKAYIKLYGGSIR